MSNALEIRVAKLEGKTDKLKGTTSKLAKLSADLQNGQMTIVDVLQELGEELSQDMRKQISQEVEAKSIQIGSEITTKVDTAIGEIEDIKEKFEEMPSPRASYELLQKLRKKVVGTLLGGTKTPQYVLISGRVFGNLTNKLNEHFKVSSYKDLSYSKIDEAKTIINEYKPHPYWVECMWNEMLLEYESGTLSAKRSNAIRKILDNNDTLMDLV